jgi:VWFA-related protein
VIARLLLAGTIAAVLGWPIPAAAQTAANAPPTASDASPTVAPETYYEAIQVRSAEVDVVVTDRAGERVPGLSRDDFALYEDGERVEIASFAPFGGGAAVPATAAAVVAGASSEPAPAPAVGPEPAAAEGMLLAIFADSQGIDPAARLRLLPALRGFLAEQLRPGDRVLLAAPRASGGLEIVLPPSADAGAASAALERALAGAGTGGPPGAATLRALIDELDRAAPPVTDPSTAGLQPGLVAYGEAEARRLFDTIGIFAQQARQRAQANAAALDELVQALAGVPGRKAALVVGAGLVASPARPLYEAWRNRFRGTSLERTELTPLDEVESDLGPRLRAIAARANGNRVSLYALLAGDAAGRASAETRTSDLWTVAQEAAVATDVRQSLGTLVEPTGGRYAVDAGPGLLRELRRDFDSYYTLGYTPRTRAAGKAHALRVEILRPGLAVRHRSQRADRPAHEAMVERTRAALLLGWQDNPLDLRAELGPPGAPDRRGVVQVPVTVMLPMAKVILLPQQAFHEGRLTLYIAASDEAGGSSPVTVVALPVRVPNDGLVAALGQQVAYRTRLGLRAARGRLAVSIRDELAGAAATTLVELGTAPAAADPPLPGDGRR